MRHRSLVTGKAMTMQFRILGSPELYDGIRRVSTPLSAPKQRRLLGALLTRPNEPIPRQELVRELWGVRSPVKSANSLNAHASLLRRALGTAEPERAQAPRLVARDSGYLLHVRPGETDFGMFRHGLERARTTAVQDPEGAYGLLRDALGLWRGAALEGAVHGPLGAHLAARLEEEREEALELLFDCALRAGRHREIVSELEEVTAAHPLHEPFHDQLMLALCRCGREAEAIAAYRRARRHLPGGADRTPLLTARLEQIGARSAVLAAPTALPRDGAAHARAADPVEPPPVFSVAGYLQELFNGKALTAL
ncbi:BTAD domain-containing putative transcriptional regulator [Streptomyces sp. NPDC006458]|uniref:AfsR/SARP family transcriptional regulator n=1 Tax=Streptomyces sp. NPDC006458 TaxID=3154302 RepID=UPI0033AB1F59